MQSQRPIGVRLWIAAFLGTTFAVTTANAQLHLRWRVDDTAQPNGDGSSWQMAFEDLQDALFQAGLGGANQPPTDEGWNEIWVAAGSGQGYKPTQANGGVPVLELRTISFDMRSRLRIFGGFEGLSGAQETLLSQRDPVANETILTGQLTIPSAECPDPNCFSGVSCNCMDCFDLVCVATGYCCVNQWNQLCRDAAGDTCPFFYNSYHVVTALNLGLVQTARLSGFTITGGKAEGNNGEFTNNFETFGGGILITGPTEAVPNDKVSPVIARCTLTDNFGEEGGGVHVTGFAAPIFLACSFIANQAREGAGIHLEPAPNSGLDDTPEATLINCLFAANTADAHGGAIDSGGPTLEVINCTFAENSALNGGGAVSSEVPSQVTIHNSILWGNIPDQIQEGGGSLIIVNYSDVQYGWFGAGSNNIDVDPCFADLSGSDFRLSFESPLIDAGDPNESVIPEDGFDIDDDMLTMEEPTPDLDMNDRILDGPPFDGTAIVDMGSFEYLCLGDITGDGLVGIVDFLDLLGAWGPNPGHLADLDGDGIVGILDFLLLLGNWGECPACIPCPMPPCVLTLDEELVDACLTQGDWDEYEDVMTDDNSSQFQKRRYDCWMRHYIIDCSKCSCPGGPGHLLCPGQDPFN